MFTLSYIELHVIHVFACEEHCLVVQPLRYAFQIRNSNRLQSTQIDSDTLCNLFLEDDHTDPRALISFSPESSRRTHAQLLVMKFGI